MSDLKPCPFCKSNKWRDYSEPPLRSVSGIKCGGCGFIMSGDAFAIREFMSATPDAGLSTADRIALAMLDDPKIKATIIPWANGKECPMLVLRIEEKNMNIHPASWGAEDERWMLTICGSRSQRPGDYMGIVSPAVAVRCRAKFEAMRKESK